MVLTALRHMMVNLALVIALGVGGMDVAMAKAKFSALAVDARTGDILFASDADTPEIQLDIIARSLGLETQRR